MIDQLRAAHRDRFFRFIKECGELLGIDQNATAKLVEDPCWFYCFDDGFTPAEAVKKYKEGNPNFQ